MGVIDAFGATVCPVLIFDLLVCHPLGITIPVMSQGGGCHSDHTNGCMGKCLVYYYKSPASLSLWLLGLLCAGL